MAKKIAYTITSNGIDGREPTVIGEAFWDEGQRDIAWNQLEPDQRTWLSKGELIVDVDKAVKEAVAKLNGLDRLVLGFATE